MTEFSLRPYWGTINYHNGKAPHKMTLPFANWNPIASGHDQGTFDKWSAGTIDSDDMIQGFISLLIPIFTNDTIFDSYTIYKQLTEDDIPEPVAANICTQVGTSVGAVIPATMSTWSFRTAALHRCKLTFLDLPVPAGFAKTYPADLNADGLAIVAYYTDADNAFAGRDNSRPNTFISATATLNEKLRRAYRLT
jgi:hypothetical protein